MSKIGKQPVLIPEKIQVTIDQNQLTVKGPKGELNLTIDFLLQVDQKDNQIIVKPKTDNKRARSMYGLTRTLIANMITGVTEGFSKTLKIEGTGYRVSKKGSDLEMTLGFSHPVEIQAPEGIQFESPDNKTIIISGIDKQLVGQVAASIRDIKKPDPYKAKGISYEGEQIKRKPGKLGKAGEAGA